jgi:hypothetical protein
VDAERKQGNEIRALSGMGYNIERFVHSWMRTIVFPILTRVSEEPFRKQALRNKGPFVVQHRTFGDVQR